MALSPLPVPRRRRPRTIAMAGRRAGDHGLPVLVPVAPRPVGQRRTRLLAGTALLGAGAVVAGEVGRVWHRGEAPLPLETDDLVGAGREAVAETVQVAAEGLRASSPRENALLTLFTSYTITFAVARASTHTIRRRGSFGPFRNLRVDGTHVHHFIPGIVLAFLSGTAAILVKDERAAPWLAVPFGAGVALTLDESALLLKLDDVYWTEEGIVSVQISFAGLAMLSALALVLRTLRRGEARVLPAVPLPSQAPPAG